MIEHGAHTGQRARQHVATVLVGAEPVAGWEAGERVQRIDRVGREPCEVHREQGHEDPEQQDGGADQERGAAPQRAQHIPAPQDALGRRVGDDGLHAGQVAKRTGLPAAKRRLTVYRPYLTRGLSRATMTSAPRFESM